MRIQASPIAKYRMRYSGSSRTSGAASRVRTSMRITAPAARTADSFRSGALRRPYCCTPARRKYQTIQATGPTSNDPISTKPSSPDICGKYKGSPQRGRQSLTIEVHEIGIVLADLIERPEAEAHL